MSDVANLFAKKKKKKKGKKGEKKDKSKKSIPDSVDSSGGATSAAPTSSTSTGWTSSTTQYKSIMGAKANSKLKKTLVVEQSEEDVKFEGMSEKQYNKHVEQDTSKKDFHKARMLADAKAKMSGDKQEEVKPPQELSWREKMEQRQKASSTNIRNQLGNASHFPTLGGAPGSGTGSSSGVGGGAWGALAEDEDIKKEVAAVLHDQDPEVIRQRELEAERLRKIEVEKKNTWGPLQDEGGINKNIEDSFIEKKVHSMIKEYLNVGDMGEVILCIKEFRNPSKHGFVLQRIFEEAFEILGDAEQLMKIAKLIVALRNEKKKSAMSEFKDTGFILTKPQIVETVEFLEECMEDIKVDVPQAPDRFEIICKHLKLRQVLPGAEKPFIPSATFAGAKEGYDFKAGANGTGYYLNNGSGSATAAPTAPTPTTTTTSSKPNPFGDAKPRAARPDPFGGAKAVTTKPSKPSPFGDAKPRAARPDPFGGAKAVTTKPSSKAVTSKPNPFGDAKPVTSKPSPFGDAKPVTSKPSPFGDAKPVTSKPSPFGDAKPVTNKPNPFGDAKPVTTGEASGEDLKALYGTKKKKKKKKGGYVA